MKLDPQQCIKVLARQKDLPSALPSKEPRAFIARLILKRMRAQLKNTDRGEP